MELQLVSKHQKCFAITLKDHYTAYALFLTHHSAQLKLAEIDLQSQTFCTTTMCLLFEGVSVNDNNYQLAYDNGFLVIVYPNQMVCIYQDNSYFSKRADYDFGVAQQLYDADLAAEGSPLALKNVIQSAIQVSHLQIVNLSLVFMSSRPVANNSQQEQVYLFELPISQVDLLTQKQQLYQTVKSKTAKQRGIYALRAPIAPESNASATDLVRVSASQVVSDSLAEDEKFAFIVTFTDGTVWYVDTKDDQQSESFSLSSMQQFAGDVKAHCVNTADAILVPKVQGYQASAFKPGDVNVLFIIYGDSRGNLVLLKSSQPVYYDQFSNNQISALKMLNTCLEFAVLTSDGVLKLCQFQPLRKQADSNNSYTIIKKASLQTFEELNNQMKMRSIHLRGSQAILTKPSDQSLEQQNGLMVVLWPKRILRNVNKRLAIDKLFAENEMQTFRYYPKVHPMVKRDLCPNVLSSILPQRFSDFVPRQDATGQIRLSCERACFLIDEIRGDLWISQYDYATNQKLPLVNVTKESGVHETDIFRVVRLDMRPATMGAAMQEAKFLVTLELGQASQESSGMCCSFSIDLESGQLTKNVLQLPGKTGIFLGKLDYKDPSILVLSQDQKSLIIFSFDEGDLDSKLPHGEVRLQSKITGVYWSPARDGLSVVYEMDQDNLLTFSKNRLDRNSVKDFGILVSRNIGLKLHYEERVFDVRWTGFQLGFAAESKNIKGVVGTNQHIYFVDDRLGVLCILKQQHIITSLQWMGEYSVLFTTSNHLMHVYGERHPSAEVVFSFTDCIEQSQDAVAPEQVLQPILVKALSDRLIFAQKQVGQETQFITRPLFMLQPLLLGYLSMKNHTNVDTKAVQSCLRYLDTNAMSQTLIQYLSQLGLDKSASFVVKNKPTTLDKVGMQPRQVLQIQDFEQFLQTLFPQRDLKNSKQDQELARKKLVTDPSAAFQRKILEIRAQRCLEQEQYQDAFACADLFGGIELQIEILERAGGAQSAELKRQFLTEASTTELYKSSSFDYKRHLTNKRSADRSLSRPAEQQIQKLILAYDEYPFIYSCKGSSNANVSEPVAMPHVPTSCENFSTFIGLSQYEALEEGGKGGLLDQFNESGADQQEDNVASFDSQVDDIDEEKYLKAYWRAEEGQGKQVQNILENELHLLAADLAWSPQPNPDRDPIEYEDKWGKSNTPSYSFQVPSSAFSLKCSHEMSIFKSGQFSLEFQLQPQASQDFILTILRMRGTALLLSRAGEQLSLCLREGDKTEENTLPVLPDQKWTHIAVTQKGGADGKLKVMADFAEVAEFSAAFAADATSSELGLLESEGATLLATELRLWRVALSSKQLRNMARQPLSLLYEKKRALNIQINKKALVQDPPRQDQNGEAEIKKPKKGGLKLKSKFDTKRREEPPQERKVEKSSPHQEEQKSQVPESAFSFAGFGDNPTQPESQGKPVQMDSFQFDGFSMPQTDPAPARGEEKPIQQVEETNPDAGNFFSFDMAPATSGEAAQPQPAASGFEGLDFFAVEQPQPVESVQQDLVEQKLEEPVDPEASPELQKKPSHASEQLAEAEPAVAGQEEPVQTQEAKPALAQDRQEISERIEETGEPNQQPSASLGEQESLAVPAQNLSFALDSNQSDDEGSVQEDRKPPQPTAVRQENHTQYEEASSPTRRRGGKAIEPIYQSYEQAQQQIETFIIQAKLPEASALLKKALEEGRAAAASVRTQEQKQLVKNQIRQIVLLKFTCDFAVKIATLKEKLKTIESQYQRRNVVSQIASMANVLILLNLPSQMRLAFFKFATKQNQAIENYAALAKIIAYWRKAHQSEGVPLPSKERDQLARLEELCKTRKQNHSHYHGDDCASCGANLAFGLATPQCYKCKAKHAICYLTLRPILKDKNMLKCHVCLAQFSLTVVNQFDSTCPYCQLVKLKSS